MEALDWAQVPAWRLRRHQLAERAPADAMLAVTPRSVRLLPAFDQYVVTATRQADHLAAWSGAELELAFTEAA